MKKIIKKVQEYPHTALAAIAILGTVALVQTAKLQISQMTTYQIERAADDLGLAEIITNQIKAHGPYYKGQ